MQLHKREYADTSIIDGFLQLYEAVNTTAFHAGYRVPGTAFKYKCSSGFALEDDSNPDRIIKCEGSRKADFSSVTDTCLRKLC